MIESNGAGWSARLRHLAEDALQGQFTQVQEAPSQERRWLMPDTQPDTGEMSRLLHELQVYHIELDMQHEELQSAQQQLALSHARYVDLYERAPVGYFTTSSDGRIVEANLTGATLLGVEHHSLLRQKLSRFILPDDQDIYYFHRRRLASKRTPQTCELRLKRPDGSAFYAHLESIPIASERMDVQYRTVVSDITDRVQAAEEVRKAREELEQRVQERTAQLERELVDVQQARAAAEAAVQMRDRMFRLVTHDLKNSLAVLQGYVYMLRRRVIAANFEDTEKIVSLVHHTDTSINRIARQIDELLDLAMLQAGTAMGVKRGVFDLVPLVRQAVDMCQHMHEKHPIWVEMAASQLVFRGDEVRVERVLTNLLTNAIKYSPEGSEVVVRVEEEARDGTPGVLVAVRDQGIGICASDLPHLFEPFWRGSNVPSGLGGLGLGLASTHYIVEQHGGSITVTSEEGVGSTFVVWLPVIMENGACRMEHA